MEKLQCFFPHWVLRLKPEMILQNKIKTFCWLNTYKEWNVGRKFGFYLSSDFGTGVDAQILELLDRLPLLFHHTFEAYTGSVCL